MADLFLYHPLNRDKVIQVEDMLSKTGLTKPQPTQAYITARKLFKGPKVLQHH